MGGARDKHAELVDGVVGWIEVTELFERRGGGGWVCEGG